MIFYTIAYKMIDFHNIMIQLFKLKGSCINYVLIFMLETMTYMLYVYNFTYYITHAFIHTCMHIIEA